MRGAAVLRRMWTTFCNFYSRASCEARRVQHNPRNNNSFFSTHAPHARRGGPFSVHHRQIRHFYSRASCEARRSLLCPYPHALTISTHAPHARRGAKPCGTGSVITISTHAPHARRGEEIVGLEPILGISTHAPHARRGLLGGQD